MAVVYGGPGRGPEEDADIVRLAEGREMWCVRVRPPANSAGRSLSLIVIESAEWPIPAASSDRRELPVVVGFPRDARSSLKHVDLLVRLEPSTRPGDSGQRTARLVFDIRRFYADGEGWLSGRLPTVALDADWNDGLMFYPPDASRQWTDGRLLLGRYAGRRPTGEAVHYTVAVTMADRSQLLPR
jgi:hypothetical protein